MELHTQITNQHMKNVQHPSLSGKCKLKTMWYTSTRMAMIKMTDIIKCWSVCGATRLSYTIGGKDKLMQMFWKMVWLWKLNIYIFPELKKKKGGIFHSHCTTKLLLSISSNRVGTSAIDVTSGKVPSACNRVRSQQKQMIDGDDDNKDVWWMCLNMLIHSMWN